MAGIEDVQDLRITGYFNPIRNQKEGACCYAFAACSVLEFLHHKNTNGEDRVILSPQDIFNNMVPNEDDQHGKTYYKTLLWLVQNGCVSENTCPYQGVVQPAVENRQVIIRFETLLPRSLKDIEYYIREDRVPIMVQMKWIDEMDAWRGDQVYMGPANRDAFRHPKIEEHAVVIVGYGSENVAGRVVKYWIIRNSHGTNWGHHGYAKFTREIVHGRFLIEDQGWTVGGVFRCDNDEENVEGDQEDEEYHTP